MVVFRRKVSIRNGSAKKDRRVPLARLVPENCWKAVPPQEIKRIFRREIKSQLQLSRVQGPGGSSKWRCPAGRWV